MSLTDNSIKKVMEKQKTSSIEQINIVIESHINNTKLNGAFIANAIGISRMTLHRRLKQECGLSANAYIQQYRLNITYRLLSNSPKTIREIANNVGFRDPSYFTKVFKKRFGELPSDYRRKNKIY